jgi:hypothetical protein
MRCSTTYFDSDAVVADVVHDRLKTGAQVRLGLLVHPRVRREHLGCDAVRAEDLVRVRCREMRSGGGAVWKGKRNEMHEWYRAAERNC